jgi:hypothetical protein
MLIGAGISGGRNVTEKEEKDFKIKRPYNKNTAHVECKKKRVLPVIRKANQNLRELARNKMNTYI